MSLGQPAAHNDAAEAETAVAIALPFPGTPKLYRRLAIWGSLAIHAYLFFGYWAIKHFLACEAWPTSWVPPVVAVVSALLFARQAYRWIMRLDAQYGRGSGWQLQSTTVKLPWERQRRSRDAHARNAARQGFKEGMS